MFCSICEKDVHKKEIAPLKLSFLSTPNRFKILHACEKCSQFFFGKTELIQETT